MNAPPLESDATLHQTGRIANALRNDGVDTEVVKNEFGEPLAVIARKVLDPRSILGSVPLRRLTQLTVACEATDEECDERYRVRDAIPIAGEDESLVLPASCLRIIDLAVQASLDRTDILAADLNGVPLVGKTRHLLGTHIDYSNNSEGEIENLPISGVNVHFVRGGSCLSSYGLVRNFADVQRIGAVEHHDRLAGELGAPFTEPVLLETGDAAIFQAGPFRKVGFLAVAHKFLTVMDGEVRYSELYGPTSFGPAETVLSLRQQIGEQYQLQSIGYGQAAA